MIEQNEKKPLNQDSTPEELQFKQLHKGLGIHDHHTKPVQNFRSEVRLSDVRFIDRNISNFNQKLWDDSELIRLSKQISSAQPVAVQDVQPEIKKAEIKPAPKLYHEYNSSRFNYLSRRSVAFLTESIFYSTICAFTLWLSLKRNGIPPAVFLNAPVLLMGALFIFIFSVSLITAQEITFGTSLGKKMTGLHIQGSPVRILLRGFFFGISTLFLGTGLIWSLFDRDGMCWHDRLTSLAPELDKQV